MNISLSEIELPTEQFRSHLPNNAVLLGAITTAVATQLFISLGVVVPFEEFRREFANQVGIWFFYNPFTTMQWLGGIFGGYVAGYYSRAQWYVGFINGVKAVLIGVVLFYVFDTALILYGPYSNGTLTASLFLAISVQRFIFFFIPVAFVYGFEAMFIGPIGNLVGHAVEGMETFKIDTPDPKRLTSLILLGSRGLFSLLVFQSIFLFLWWVFYRLQNLTYAY